MLKLTLIRGLPGSGKSTYAKKLQDENTLHYEADMYFMFSGEYKFDKNLLKAAHIWCKRMTKEGLEQNKNVVVSNTFSEIWEMKPYVELAKKFNAALEIIEMKHKFESVHDVPKETIQKMKRRWAKKEDIFDAFGNENIVYQEIPQ